MKTKGLTLVEAHATGRKYRMVGSTYGYGWYVNKNFVVTENGIEHPAWVLTIEAACARYDLEPVAKLLTREDVDAAFNLAWEGRNSLSLKHGVMNILFGPEDV